LVQISGRLDQEEQSYETFDLFSQTTLENYIFSVFTLKLLKAKFGKKCIEKLNFFNCFHSPK
jgi:hypothetical protein